MKNIEDFKRGEVIIYKDKRSKIDLNVKFEKETVWLTQERIANLFGVKRPAITKHLRNIFKEGELNENSVSSILEHTASDGKKYKTKFYNLDAIISVGYRVNSKRATDFRIWATEKLRDYLLNGYLINQERLKNISEKRLNEFKRVIEITKNLVIQEDETKGVLNVITDYAETWLLLQKYDEGQLPETKKRKAKFVLGYDFSHTSVNQLKDVLIKKNQATDLFGKERDSSFSGVLGAIQQSFSGQELYPSIEDKAAHLLYFIIKDHPFFDGNKRIGSFLFLVFLSQNNYFKKKSGEKKIDENTLVALALFIAQSDRKDKDLIVKLIINFVKEK